MGRLLVTRSKSVDEYAFTSQRVRKFGEVKEIAMYLPERLHSISSFPE